ncbi:hypothetical protein [Glycomyces sp. NRRL B-16210]|uniref:hypothetical protein n=1 Tax=Glycomyces sp. NRRL B-16210 TaxID=1463821 RepID=UPI00105DB465|nr:hypothetical protein [Glycomyces sp. NRRL B-16210]
MFSILVLLLAAGCNAPSSEERGIERQRDPEYSNSWDTVFEGVTFPNAEGEKVNSGGTAPIGYISYQPPILPFSITIDSNWQFSLSASYQFVSSLGTVEVGSEQILKSGTDEKVVTEHGTSTLIVCNAEPDEEACEAFTIHSGRKLTVYSDGASSTTLEHSLTTIQAMPGTTLEIVDAGAADEPVLRENRIAINEWHFHDQSDYVEIDLEQEQSGIYPDLRYDRLASGTHNMLIPINGTKVATWAKHVGEDSDPNSPLVRITDTPTYPADFPAPSDCLDKDADEWSESLDEEAMAWGMTFLCVITAEGDVGYLLVAPVDTKPISFYIYSYIWVY